LQYQTVKKQFEELRSRKRIFEKKDQELKLLRKISGITHIETQLEGLGKEIQDQESQVQKFHQELRRIGEQLLRQERSLLEANKNAGEVDSLKENRTRLQDLVEKSKRLKDVTQKIAVL